MYSYKASSSIALLNKEKLIKLKLKESNLDCHMVFELLLLG